MIFCIINSILGVWLMAAPEILNYQGRAADNDQIFGPIIASISITAIFESTRNMRWLNIPFAIWLIMAPFVLSYDDNYAGYNDVLTGIFVGSFSLIKGKIHYKFGGGWAALFKKAPDHLKES